MDVQEPERLARLMACGLAMFCELVPQGEVLWTPSGVAALSGSSDPGYNTTLLWGGAEPVDLARLVDFLAARGRFATHLMSAQALDVLAPYAPLYGLVPAGRMPIMAFEPRTAAAPRLGPYRVERLSRWADVRDIAAPMVMEAFGLPPKAALAVLSESAVADRGLDVFVAWRRSTAMSTVYTTRIDDAVGIWSMATPVRHRRQGAGRAVLQAAMAHHMGRGARLFYLGATAQGMPLYEQLGFATKTTLAVWATGPAAQTPPNPSVGG